MVGSLKVLLVEDNEDTAQMMATALEMRGHHVVLARDAPGAFAAVSFDCPDVGLLDIGLPGMTGYRLAAKLRASGFCPPSMKLIAVSGYAGDSPALVAAGLDGHLLKPVNLQELYELLADIAMPEENLERPAGLSGAS